jgi:hypothetical protein
MERSFAELQHVDSRAAFSDLEPNNMRDTAFHYAMGWNPSTALRDPPTEWSRQFEALGLNPN